MLVISLSADRFWVGVAMSINFYVAEEMSLNIAFGRASSKPINWYGIIKTN